MEPISSNATEPGADVQAAMDRRRADLDAKLEQNKQVRQAARESRLVVQGEEEKLPEEDYNLIDEYFNSTYADLTSRVTGWREPLAGKAVAEITAYFDLVHADSWALRDQLTAYQYAIPTGIFSRYQAQMKQLQEIFTEQKEAAMPKKKFAFVRKARKAPATAAASAQPQPASAPQTSMTEQIVATGNHLLIKDVANDQSIVKTAAEYEGKENVIVENLTDCTVILPFSIKCIYIKNIARTRIYVGSVSGASFVNEATDCFIHLQSHQIRIHNSQRVHFYLTARSNPIIEHCSEMKFGPYIDTQSGEPALSFAEWQQQAEAVGLKLEGTTNLFGNVLDFDWHKQDHSPNWEALETSTPHRLTI